MMKRRKINYTFNINAAASKTREAALYPYGSIVNCSGFALSPINAAAFSQVQLYNPEDSNALILITVSQTSLTTAGVLSIREKGAPLTAGAKGFVHNVDRRGGHGQALRNPLAQIWTREDAALQGDEVGRSDTRVSANTSITGATFDIAGSLSPGRDYILAPSIINNECRWLVRWLEIHGWGRDQEGNLSALEEALLVGLGGRITDDQLISIIAGISSQED